MKNNYGVAGIWLNAVRNSARFVTGHSSSPGQGIGRRRMVLPLCLFGAVVAGWLAVPVRAAVLTTNLVEKVADLSFFTDTDGAGHGGYAPLDRFVQVGTNLWFTTKSGGTLDLGTISRFDLGTHQVVQVATLDNNTGSNPESPLTVIDQEAYFTTVSKGMSNKGTISKIDLNSGNITPLFAFPNNGLPTGATPRAGLTLIGNDLWTTTSLGGSTGRGVVVKYNLTRGTASLVTNLDGPLLGGQSTTMLVPVGNAWYFTAATGGDTFNTTNYPVSVLPDGSTIIITNKLVLGGGTLDRLTFDGNGNPVISKVLSVPGGFTQFLYEEPTLVGTNSLYFTSTGPNSLPGAISRYDLDTGYFTNLFSFSTNPVPAALYGTRPGYSGLVEWQGELYFINRNGGTNTTVANSGGGTVAKYNIAANTVIKLADLGGPVPETDLGSPSGFFGTGTIVQETNRFYIYYPLTSGGANLNLSGTGLGTIIRVSLPPPPIQLTIVPTNNATNFNLSWTGGYPPFDVLTNSDVSVPTTNWGAVVSNLNSDTNTTNWTVTLPAAGDSTFYRIRGQAQ
ncbi:MAG: hypothetical protein P4N60_05015 [Verrucomicrobiae bacterium]|nr:hypothetical protein [Verrucomicrobiae bacterium]